MKIFVGILIITLISCRKYNLIDISSLDNIIKNQNIKKENNLENENLSVKIIPTKITNFEKSILKENSDENNSNLDNKTQTNNENNKSTTNK